MCQLGVLLEVMKKHRNKEWLVQKYCIEGLPIREVARLGSVSHNSIWLWLRKLGITRRTPSESRVMNPERMWKPHLDKEWLYEKYVQERLSLQAIANICNVKQPTIWKCLQRFQFLKRLSLRGPEHMSWSGGKSVDSMGYILVNVPDHPNCNCNGRVQEHRLIAEQALGRYLKKNEIIHHMNQDRKDNRNENLIVCTHSYHQWLHWNRYPHKKREPQRQLELGVL